MSTPDPTPPSVEAIWRRYDAIEARVAAGLSERMLDLAQLRPGARVLDLASGRGEPALRAAARVGPAGFVLGVDVSESMLAMGRERAEREGLGDIVELRVADAEQLDGVPDAHFDAVTARWGLMYMTRPVAALCEARRVLRSGGRVVAALWAEPERVAYYSLPRQLLGEYSPPTVVDPDVPGVFRYAAVANIERDFARAGLDITHLEELEVPVVEVDTGVELMEWARAFGLGRLLAPLPASVQDAWEQRMIEAAESLRATDGLIRWGGVTRIVVATPRATNGA